MIRINLHIFIPDNISSEEDEKILTKEVKSWKGFEYALREPNATLFNKMLKECLENEEYAFKTIAPQDPVARDLCLTKA